MDLFEQFETLPQEVQDVLNEYWFAENDYDTCMDLVEHLEKVGYTCDYGLDAVPFNLRKNFSVGDSVRVAECYLTDEVTEPFRDEISATATVCSVPSDSEELVSIQYESGLIDFVPQEILEVV